MGSFDYTFDSSFDTDNWPYTNRLPEFRTSSQRAGFVEIVMTATPACAEWTAVDLWVSGAPDRAPSRNRS